MGFADYLSRHPNSPPTGVNIYENHLINTIEALHYTSHTAHRKLTNQIARKRKTHNEVVNHPNSNRAKHIAFCYLHAIEQLSSFAVNKPHNKHSISKHIIQKNFISDLQLDPLFRKKDTCHNKNQPVNKHIYSADQETT